MQTIIGLGNPGKTYEMTRHNVGFLIVDALAEQLNINWKAKSSVEALLAEGQHGDERILLAKPQTFMNVSGRTLTAIMSKYPVTREGVTIVYDDADLSFGDVRVKTAGGSAGHRGMESILSVFPRGTAVRRIRVGIGRPNHPDILLEDFVLQKFTATEKEALPDIIAKAISLL